ncbi:hypothetical protein [Alkaliphilus sp. B6464]|uniref:hypothetical protein n=1 Tax=Alkaliphilus sp. B6464 TaxID=2731219 RepID=UPI001BA835D8|nr:hypothetical protein [Alkaliphilus sp. B6464]QUH20132.1 hypothetical protein HYG84_09585 [Alkaliphilus sp. B6464]
MKRKICFFTSIIIIISWFVLVGCGEKNESINESEEAFEMIKDLGTTFQENTLDKSFYEIIDGEVADILSYNYQDRSIYVAGLKVFEEFGISNEGGVSISADGKILTLSMIKSTGSVTGALDGPYVYFKINLVTDEIIEKKFEPAPDYTELGRLEFAEYSNEVIELSDEQILQVGLYFKDLIREIEAN